MAQQSGVLLFASKATLQIEEIKDWRGKFEGKRFFLEKLFKCAQQIYMNLFEKDDQELFNYYYDFLCNQVHFSPIVDMILEKQIFGFPPGTQPLKELLHTVSGEFIRFFAIGLHYNASDCSPTIMRSI